MVHPEAEVVVARLAEPSSVSSLPAAGPARSPHVATGNMKFWCALAGGGVALGCMGIVVLIVIVVAIASWMVREPNDTVAERPEFAAAEARPVTRQEAAEASDAASNVTENSTPKAVTIPASPPSLSGDQGSQPRSNPAPSNSPVAPAADRVETDSAQPSVTPRTARSSLDTTDPLDVSSPATEPHAAQPETTQPALSPAATPRYRWKPGDRHAYAITISGEVANKKETLNARCTYRVESQITDRSVDVREGSGTGFVVAANGYLISCAHVVEDATKITVTLADKQYDAKVVDQDFQQDVALLRISAENLAPLPLANSDEVALAQEIRAVGYPLSDVLGKNVKVTRGTVSGMVDEPEGRRFQIDAAINPGNSGGPVVDERGEVVGIASAKLMGIAVSQVAFAVPANEARRLLERHGVASTARGAGEMLSGPELANRVTPSVAFIEVTTDPSRQNQYRVTFSGSTGTGSDAGSIHVSELGEVEDYEGTQHLPFVLGPLGMFMIDDLDSHGELRWGSETQSELRIMDSQQNDLPFGPGFGPRFGPFGPGGSGGGFGPRFPSPGNPFASRSEPKVKQSYPAIERVRYRWGQQNDRVAMIHKTYEFRTLENNSRPYLLTKGSGTITFDREIGMPTKYEYSAAIDLNVEDASLRIPLKAEYRRRTSTELAEEDRKRAEETARRKAEADRKKHEAEIAATVPNPQRVNELIASIKSKKGDHWVHQPMSELSKLAVVENRREEVIRLASPDINHENGWIRNAAIHIVCTWGTEKHHLELLPQLLDNPRNEVDIWARPAIIKTLGQYRDPAAVKAVAARLEHRQDANQARDLLIALGPAVEDIVLVILQGSSDHGRTAAAEVLAKVGTKKSLSIIAAQLKTEKNVWAKGAMEKALPEILGRG